MLAPEDNKPRLGSDPATTLQVPPVNQDRTKQENRVELLLPRVKRPHPVKVGVNVKAVLTSLNLSTNISVTFKATLNPSAYPLTTAWQFCVNFRVIFLVFWERSFFFPERIG